MPVDGVLCLPDRATLADLTAFVGRAKRVDADGAARLIGHGDVLAVYVSPVHGGGGPTILGLRTLALARASDVDTTVPLAALADRFARLEVGRPAGQEGVAFGGMVELPLPPVPATGVAWAGVAPPRRGWESVGLIEPALLDAAAREGVAEVAEGTPAGAGAAAVATLRARVWGRPLSADLPDVPAGVAFAADALGFVRSGEPAAVYRYRSWTRLTTSAGHVLAKASALL